MTNTHWSESDLDAAAARVERSVSHRLHARRRLRRGGVAAGVVVLGVTGIAAATTLLPPQARGEIGAGAPYLGPVASCLRDAGWNVWVASSDGFEIGQAVHFSVDGDRQPRFAEDVDRCRDDVARATGATWTDVVGLG
ncbi:hypothetical protein [Frigoribacterium salinisoli]